MLVRSLRISLPLLAFALTSFAQTTKPPIGLDAYFGATDYASARISPDGTAAVIATSMADWKANRFRDDLWLWRDRKLMELTSSGHDAGPEWSPDGQWIAFVSDRALPGEAEKDAKSRLWLIPAVGGGVRPLYRENAEVHAFAWAADASALYFSMEEPLSKNATEAKEKEWKNVIRWREDERGDLLLRMPVAKAEASMEAAPLPNAKEPEVKPSEAPLPEGAEVVARNKLAIDSIEPSPDGKSIAFITTSVSKRLERPQDVEIYLTGTAAGASKTAAGAPEAQQLTHNQALESNVHWSPDSQRLYFAVHAASGSLEGKYTDVQGRLYGMRPQVDARPERLGSEFAGSWEDYTVLPDGGILATGLKGTETQVYRVEGAHAAKVDGVPGTYGGLDAARKGKGVLLVHSAIDEPTEVYLANSAGAIKSARPATKLNERFLDYAQPEWRPYRWKAEDGAEVEGVLLYPPGKRNAQRLPMLTLIHGGPADADGDRWGANWYDWAGLAAAQGWLVFRPNYRGSSGYGDTFMLGIMPHLVSRPGKDILEGVDALVKEGAADPGHLAIGGYSYGGYMTDWLITQTTRFKAAMTGAGAVEHAANWGNDDETFDDAWYLGGRPWENPQLYQSEAALFQMNKVTTPTHLVGGNADVRVSFLEDVLLERALESLGVPHTFLVFPEEGHGLGKDPWHGYIKVREELKWMQKYAGTGAASGH